jgi:hypothetical protein
MYFGIPPVRPNVMTPLVRGMPANRGMMPSRPMMPAVAQQAVIRPVQTVAPGVFPRGSAPAAPASWVPPSVAFRQQRQQHRNAFLQQQADFARQQAAFRAQATSSVVYPSAVTTPAMQPSSMVVAPPQMPAPTPSVQPGQPEADLTPAQDAADPPVPEAPPSSEGISKRTIFIGVGVLAAAIGAVVVVKKMRAKKRP